MLRGIAPSSLEMWFGFEVLGIPVAAADLTSVQDILPRLMSCLGFALPTHSTPAVEKAARPFADILLKLSHFRMEN